MTKVSEGASRLTAKEYACLHMKVPQSGTEWLDEMIQAARDLDAEQFQTKLQERKPHPVLGPSPYDGPAKASKRPKKEPEMRDQKD